eukprot:527077-Rhodomonas_salina.1
MESRNPAHLRAVGPRRKTWAGALCTCPSIVFESTLLHVSEKCWRIEVKIPIICALLRALAGGPTSPGAART